MMLYRTEECSIALPLPLFVVVEDVGWWEGENGSAVQQPYRNGFPRRHCLADYRALTELAERLSSRIAIAMVMGEWDRSNLLRDVPGATWMGVSWDNRRNHGPWLDEAAEYLRAHQHHLELAVHGICHEFWREGKMERSEFHDSAGRMRARDLVVAHLQAYQRILEENGWHEFPRIFVPPALKHGFGNGDDSMQAVLRDYGIGYVTTRFDRARQYSLPIHEKLTWECGVALLERGLSPVPWDQFAAQPAAVPDNPVVALHWGNLIHPDPQRNPQVVDGWVRQFSAAAAGMERIMAADAADCWRQAAVCYLADCRPDSRGLSINLRHLPKLSSLRGPFSLKVRGGTPEKWQCRGATLQVLPVEQGQLRTVRISPLTDAVEISTPLF